MRAGQPASRSEPWKATSETTVYSQWYRGTRLEGMPKRNRVKFGLVDCVRLRDWFSFQGYVGLHEREQKSFFFFHWRHCTETKPLITTVLTLLICQYSRLFVPFLWMKYLRTFSTLHSSLDRVQCNFPWLKTNLSSWGKVYDVIHGKCRNFQLASLVIRHCWVYCRLPDFRLRCESGMFSTPLRCMLIELYVRLLFSTPLRWRFTRAVTCTRSTWRKKLVTTAGRRNFRWRPRASSGLAATREQKWLSEKSYREGKEKHESQCVGEHRCEVGAVNLTCTLYQWRREQGIYGSILNHKPVVSLVFHWTGSFVFVLTRCFVERAYFSVKARGQTDPTFISETADSGNVQFQ